MPAAPRAPAAGETRDWWNATSERFQEEGVIPVGVRYGPGCPDDDGLGLLPDVAGADTVRHGCGGAQWAVGLARRGAASVTGVDLSIQQLAYADRLTAEHGVDASLVLGDVTARPLADDAFDLAFSAYALQGVGDLDSCFSEAARVLREGGAFVLSLPHPFYGVFDPETGAVARRYFGPGERWTGHEGVEPDRVLFHHRLEAVHGALRDAGVVVETLLEPGTDDPDAYEERWDSKPELMARVPRTPVVRAVL